MRCFVALPVPAEAREHLDAWLEPRRAAEPTLRWSDPFRWHVTLAFMPDVPEWAVEELLERLTEAGRKRSLLTVRLAGGGVFGGAATARVLWAGLGLDEDDAAELRRLAGGARNAAAVTGARVEGGEFVPHMTVARSPRPRDLTHLLDVLDPYTGPTWRADEIHLVESHLGDGARHEVVGTAPLGEPDDDAWWRRGLLRPS